MEIDAEKTGETVIYYKTTKKRVNGIEIGRKKLAEESGEIF